MPHLCLTLPFHFNFEEDAEEDAFFFMQTAIEVMNEQLLDLLLMFPTIEQPESGFFPGIEAGKEGLDG